MRLISLLAGLAIGVAPLGALGAEATGRMSIGVTIVNNACSVGTARCQSPVPTAPRVTAPNYVTYRAATSIAPAVWTRTY